MLQLLLLPSQGAVQAVEEGEGVAIAALDRQEALPAAAMAAGEGLTPLSAAVAVPSVAALGQGAQAWLLQALRAG